MRTRKVVVSRIRARGLRIIPAAALAASLGMLALGGCSSQNADTPTAPPMNANFALEKCQQLDANLYKCPAIDQPLCTPEFTRTDVNCVHIGPKGSVFIQRQGANP
jgi:hypothetical protein